MNVGKWGDIFLVLFDQTDTRVSVQELRNMNLMRSTARKSGLPSVLIVWQSSVCFLSVPSDQSPQMIPAKRIKLNFEGECCEVKR